jgi:hypothetical protein
MPSRDRPPGLAVRKNADGSERIYWTASKEAAALGYEPRTVRLHPDDDEHLASMCLEHETRMLAWVSERVGAAGEATRNITIAGLFRAYRTRPESPYHMVKWNTQRGYSQLLDTIERDVGDVKLRQINLALLRRWYENARWPQGRGAGKPEHLTLAHKIISMLRRVVSFGVAAEIEGCERLATILSNSRFEAPGRRQVAMPPDYAMRFVAAARAAGRPSLALATALQWECSMRQKDVIGEWEPITAWGRRSGIVMNRKQWVNGLTWADISDDWVLTKQTTKTGQVVEHDLKLCPMALEILSTVAPEDRHGPLIIDEKAGRPYAEFGFYKDFRKIADAAGLPRGVWSMDARAGGATEASEAGASLQDMRPTMGHSDEKTTLRYVRGSALEQSRRVATARLALRNKKG